jgi:hypothetical protein
LQLLREKARRETGKQVTKTSEELAAMQVMKTTYANAQFV